MKTYQKVEDTVSQHFKGYAHVAVVLEPIQHFYAETEKKQTYYPSKMCHIIYKTPEIAV